MTSPSISSWEDFFTKNPILEYLNKHLKTIQDSVNPQVKFIESAQEISKNPGVTLLALDASEGLLQIFHHPTVLGGNWIKKSEKIVAVLGFQDDASQVKLIEKSIKESKGKTPSLEKFSECMGDDNPFRNLKNLKTDYHYLNVIPLPHLLTKTFLTLKSTDPISVAIAFFHAMHDFDTNATVDSNKENDITSLPFEDSTTPNSSQEIEEIRDETNFEESKSPGTPTLLTGGDFLPNQNKFLSEFFHVLQFCFLC
jgi:hypothetical protein